MGPRNIEYHDVEIEVDGVRYRASYYAKAGWIHLSSELGSKNAALNRAPAEGLARLLLHELVQTKLGE